MKTNNTKKVIIVENQVAVREMIATVISLEGKYEVIGQASEGQYAYELGLELKPDVMVVDAMLAGLKGVEVIRRLSKRLPQTRMLVFSAYRNITLVKDVIQARAHGFIEKTASLDEFKKGLDAVANGGSYFGPKVTQLIRNAVMQPESPKYNGAKNLTTREREILQLVAESYSTKEIAKKLSISAKTADNHRTNLMRKLDLHNVASLIRFAIGNELVENPAVIEDPKVSRTSVDN